MMAQQMKWMISVALGLGLAMTVASPSASAQNGAWTWGPPGWSAGFEVRHVERALIDVGLADPNRDYFTPGLPGGTSSVYTGTYDTGYQNTFAVNHDINAHAGIPGFGYIDIFTPAIGTNELAIASTVSSIWSGVVETVSNLWGWFTGLFAEKYYDMSEFGGFEIPVFEFDNGFDISFVDYGSLGGGGGGGDDDPPPDPDEDCGEFLCPFE